MPMSIRILCMDSTQKKAYIDKIVRSVFLAVAGRLHERERRSRNRVEKTHIISQISGAEYGIAADCHV
uniref:Uncharacterized protein n=1 Tax=Pristionchus pacificus TaxID=54126 RepID=A0A2A6CKG6_PRIPA|eukprot:PDM78692.1 hypothetical protein PRIPAC_31271 [Pristionchus pacificus]